MANPIAKHDFQFGLFDALPVIVALAILAVTASILLQWPR